MVNPQLGTTCRLFTRSQVEALLDLDSVIEAVEGGFRRQGVGDPPPSGVLGLHPPGGGFHVKTAVFPGGGDGRLYLAAKLNTNFPANPVQRGLPTIQGLLGLFDATNGIPLAVMDSAAVTAIRTAAATAVAVKHLARADASTLALAGCGAQSLAQVAAVARVRALARVIATDLDPAAAGRFIAAVTSRLGIPAEAAIDFRTAAAASDIVITCTPSQTAFLGAGDVSPGCMVAAVGADNEHKSELEPALMRHATVVTDSTSQCALIGDLHHAIAAGVMTSGEVHAELGQVVAGLVERPDPAGGVVVFDSTGLPFQDVVAAALVYERGVAAGVGAVMDFKG